MLLVVLICIGIYWVRLGADAFVYSEGHRALPAWSMLDSGDFLVPRLFGQVYLRKPPGIFWAIAASSELLGRTEFGARAVSAAAMTLGALLSLFFANRWFGRMDPMAGLIAGMAHALSPWFWQIGRVAEIESLHQLAVQASVLLLIEAMVAEERRSWRATIGLALTTGCSLAAMALVKGPAGVPCIGAAMAAACIVARSGRPLLRPALRGAVLVAGIVLVVAFGAMLSAVARTGGGAVSQSLDEFLWNPKELKGIALLLPTAIGSALPMAFALLYPWGARPTPFIDANRIAKALAWACLLSLAVYQLMGVNNRRYTLPAFSFLGPLTAYAAARIATGVVVGIPMPLARWILADRPAAWFAGMVILAGLWLGIVEPRRAAHGGRAPGLAIADAILRQEPGGRELWADDMVEARPDVLNYAATALAEHGRPLTVRWLPIAESPAFPPPGDYLAIRTDTKSEELRLFRAAGLEDRANLICSDRIHEFSFDIYQVRNP